MPQYRLEFRQDGTASVTVDAATPDEAFDTALQLVEDYDASVEYVDDAQWVQNGSTEQVGE